MAFNEVKAAFQSRNILESEIGLVTKTRTGVQSGAATVNGRKYIKAGSLYTGTDGNGNTEYGVVFQDYDVTDDAKYPISVIFAGRVRADRVASAVLAKKSDLAAQGLYLVYPIEQPTGATGATGATS